MAAAFGPVIATRKLQVIETGLPVTVQLEKPKQRAGGEYACRFRIRGLGRAWIGQAFGEDSMQAIQLVFETLRQALSPLAPQLSWYDEPRQLGFYRIVPEVFGPVPTRRIHAALERAMRREAQVAIRLAKRRARRGAAA